MQDQTPMVDFPAGRNSLHKAGEVKLHVCNLPYSTSHAQIGALFARYGEVLEAFVLKRPHPVNNFRSAIVRMAPAEAAEAAMQELNGVVWRGNVLRVQRSKHDMPLMGVAQIGSDFGLSAPPQASLPVDFSLSVTPQANPYEAPYRQHHPPGPIRTQPSFSQQCDTGILASTKFGSHTRYTPYTTTLAKPASVCFPTHMDTCDQQQPTTAHTPDFVCPKHTNGFWQPQSVIAVPRANFVNPFHRAFAAPQHFHEFSNTQVQGGTTATFPHYHQQCAPAPPNNSSPTSTPLGNAPPQAAVSRSACQASQGKKLRRKNQNPARPPPQGLILPSASAVLPTSSSPASKPVNTPGANVMYSDEDFSVPSSPVFVHQPYAPMEWE